MALSKQQIIDAVDLKTRVEPVPEWGDDVIVSEFDVARRMELDLWLSQYNQMDGAGEEDGQTKMQVPLLEFQQEVLRLSLVDEDGEPLFAADERAALKKKNPDVLAPLIDIAFELNGMGADAVETASKNSDAAQSGDSSSSSA